MANETPDQAPIAELEYEPSAFEQAFQKHKSKVILVAILGGVGLLGYYSMKFWKEHQDTKDGQAFFKAETIADYERVAQDLSGRNAGGNALLMAAQLLVDNGKPKDAVTKLQAFVKDYPNHPLADLGTLRLADAQALAGNIEESKATLAQVFEKFPKSPHAPLAMLRLGDQLASEKKIDEARKVYDNLRSKYTAAPGADPSKDYWTVAKSHSDALGRKEPTPVAFVPDPVPAPPTPGAPNAGQPGGAPSTTLDVPSLNPGAEAPAAPEKMLEVPKLDAPAREKPAAEVPAPTTPAAETPAKPEAPAPATPETPAPAKPAEPAAPEKPADK